MKDFLLLLARYPFEEMNRERLKKLTGEVRDWNRATTLIRQHGITALAAYNIIEAGLEKSIPEDSFSFLQNGLRKNIARNTWLNERWKEIDALFVSESIQHILLKGMALEHSIYGARGLRQMNDIDIYIDTEKAQTAWKLLKNSGFDYGNPKSALHIKLMKNTGRHLPALYKDSFAVEIHTCLFGYGTSSVNETREMFENARKIHIGEREALIPDNETHYRYLVSHFRRHMLSGESQIRTYSDLILLSGKPLFSFPQQFILKPDQTGRTEFRKASYRSRIRFMKPKNRMIYILGDLFPSLSWMKERYRCGNIKAILHYPHRLGKLAWLIRQDKDED